MKTSIKNLLLLPALITGFGFLPIDRVTAQTFTTVHNFLSNTDGASPFAELILSGNTLYGTTILGGNFGLGMAFAVQPDGNGFTNLHSFTAGSDGGLPVAGLIKDSSGTTLYGTARIGGSGSGTIFALGTNGLGFTNLHSFTSASDGADPQAGLVLSGNTLYGTALAGGSSGKGTVFSVHTDGTGFTNLHSFTSATDGENPQASLVLLGNTLYGTAQGGGSGSRGTVFAINTNGTGFTNLHSFTPTPSGINNDGANPVAGLIASGNTLYGTAQNGGSSGFGVVFALNSDGTGFTNLHSFFTASDGAHPMAGLLLSGNTLYGTAFFGGSADNGTVFALKTNGTGFTNLHSFTVLNNSTNSDGVHPRAGLILSGNTLFGTAQTGGNLGDGTVFSISLGAVSAPQLTIIALGANVILTWTNTAGFTLQSAPSVTGAFTNIVPTATSPFTNSISGGQRFFRLSQ